MMLHQCKWVQIQACAFENSNTKGSSKSSAEITKVCKYKTVCNMVSTNIYSSAGLLRGAIITYKFQYSNRNLDHMLISGNSNHSNNEQFLILVVQCLPSPSLL